MPWALRHCQRVRNVPSPAVTLVRMIQFESKGQFPLRSPFIGPTKPLHPAGLTDLRTVSVFDESISDTTDGVEVAASASQFFPQAPHVGIDRSSVDDVVIFPDIAEQLLT